MDGHEVDESAADHGEGRSGVSRRGFLVGAAGLTGVAVSGVWRAPAARAAETSGSASRATSPSGSVFLELEGKLVGTVGSVDGGSPFADVVVEKPGADGIAHKHLAGVKYEDFMVQAGLGMGKPLYDWVSSFMDRKSAPMNGAFIGVDSELRVKRRTDFSNALLTEVGFPACDAASKDPGFMTLKVSPETTANSPGDNTPVGGRPSNQKQWLPSNFRLRIPGLDTSAVSALQMEYPVKWELSDGRLQEPGKIEYPNIKVSLAESHAKSWYDWFDSFVIKGSNGQENELVGLLEWPTPDLSRVLGSVGLSQLGIMSIAPDSPQPSVGVRRVQVEMYCEVMSFNFRPTRTT